MGLNLLWEGSNLSRLLKGLAITAEIAFISVFFACILGVVFGLIMTIKNRWVQAISHFYLEFVRIIPLLALLFIAWCAHFNRIASIGIGLRIGIKSFTNVLLYFAATKH